MSLREQAYSILIVSARDNFASAFADLLTETRYFPIYTAASVSAAKRILAEKPLILSLSTRPCLTRSALVLLLTSVPANNPLCCFW
ncbi:hypothetical protein C823_006746 [Eubacterium plexicaudatum ASF492]|nr:hypothetical protein C823_006746 [Eubacterium plexicaudatum ASF492]